MGIAAAPPAPVDLTGPVESAEATEAAEATSASPAGCPKYLALAKHFERQLRAGVLRVGDRLPSVRQLRTDHHVSAATAIGCYLWLERQGYVRARPRSGFYVSRAPVTDGPPPAVGSRVRGPVPVSVGGGAAECQQASGRRAVIELGPAVVGPALLPMNRLNRSIRMALAAASDNAVRYEHPRGNTRLRRQIARLMFRQGATTSADAVVVTSGSTEALNLAIRAVARPNDVIAVESPGCYEVLHALESLHVRALEIPHRPKLGVDLDAIAAAMRRHRVKAIITNATCHNPFGDCVTDAGKAAIVAFAARHGMAIVEADTFGDLVFTGERPRSLTSFDRHGLVIQCASLAHYVAPGFNLGWIHAGRVQDEVERLKAITNLGSSRLAQVAMAEFLESGAFDRHVKQLRVALWRSVEASRHEVLRLFPAGTRVSRPEGGMVLWIQLPAGHDGAAIQRRAAEAGINILPGEIFSPTGQYRDCIRISCGHPFEIIRPAIRTIAKLVSP